MGRFITVQGKGGSPDSTTNVGGAIYCLDLGIQSAGAGFASSAFFFEQLFEQTGPLSVGNENLTICETMPQASAPVRPLIGSDSQPLGFSGQTS